MRRAPAILCACVFALHTLLLAPPAAAQQAAAQKPIRADIDYRAIMPQPVQVQPLDAVTVLVTQGLAADNRVLVQGAALVAQIR